MRYRSYAVLFLVLLFSRCGDPETEQVPSDLLDREKFTAVMVDVQLAEGMKVHKLGPKRGRSPDMEAMYAVIFESHGIGQDDFQNTYDYYKARPEMMESIYEQVLDSLSKLDVRVKKIYNSPKNRKDTLDIDSITNAAAQRRFRPLGDK